MLVGLAAVLTLFTDLWLLSRALRNSSRRPRVPDSLAAITIIRFGIAFLVLIVPTSLMGSALPLVIKSAVAPQDRVARTRIITN